MIGFARRSRRIRNVKSLGRSFVSSFHGWSGMNADFGVQASSGRLVSPVVALKRLGVDEVCVAGYAAQLALAPCVVALITLVIITVGIGKPFPPQAHSY